MTARKRLIVLALLTLSLGAALGAVAGAASASVDYRSASFVDQQHGWIAGLDNQTSMSEVWRTADGGLSWSKMGSVPAAGAGYAWVAFATKSVGLWGSGAVHSTTNGGDSWTEARLRSGPYNEAAFASATVGWTVYSNGSSESGGGVCKTMDGGATWKRQVSRPGPDGSGGFSRVSAPTTSSCYALRWGAKGGVWTTADGGSSWTKRSLPAIKGRYKFYKDVDFPVAKVGWAVGDSGRIVKTTNAGATWKTQRSGLTSILLSVDFVDTRVGFAVGTKGVVLRTLDGGAHWTRLVIGTTKGLVAVSFVDALHGWVVGMSGARLMTADGGTTWQAF